MKGDLLELESTPADDDSGFGLDIQAGRLSLDGTREGTPPKLVFNSLLWLLNMRTYKYSFNVLLSCILIMELVIFFKETNNWNINVDVLRYVCCAGFQITAFLVVMVLLYGTSSCQNRHVLTRCLLDTFIWIPASTLSILSLQNPSIYLTVSTILFSTLRFLSHNSLQWATARHLANSSGGGVNPRLLPIFRKAYQPFLAESRCAFVVLVLSSCWIALSSALTSFLEGLLLNAALSKESTFGIYLLLLLLVVPSVRLSYMLQEWLLGLVGGKAVAKMQRKMLDNVCYGNSKFVENHAPGKLANTFGGSLKQVYLLWGQTIITRILTPAINIVVVICFLGTVNVPFMLLCIASIPIVFSIKPVQRKSVESSKEMTEAFAVSQAIFENVVSLRK